MQGEAETRTSVSLLARLRQSPADDSAWEAFVRRYTPVLLQWCRAWHLQDADAEDVTQRVLQQLVRTLRSFDYDPTRSFRGLLKTLTRHAWADLLHGHQRGVAGTGDTAVWRVLQSVEARDNLEQRLREEFDRELLEEAMALVRARVEERTWEAFRLLALEGLSGALAAARVGMTVAATFKARSKVQRMLRDEVVRQNGAGVLSAPPPVPGHQS